MEKQQVITINSRKYTVTDFDDVAYNAWGDRNVNLLDSKGNEKFAIFRGDAFLKWDNASSSISYAIKYNRVKGMR